MASLTPSTSRPPSTVTFAPSLTPLLPTPSLLSPLLSPLSPLPPSQKHLLAQHALHRALLFADLPLLQFLLGERGREWVDLRERDAEGRGAVVWGMEGFGTEGEREVEREECCRLLVAEGADITSPDDAGWTPLHYAALLAPPTLINHLLALAPSLLHTRTSSLPSPHSPSPLTPPPRPRTGLTPLDTISASNSPIPGREGVALMLEDAMGAGGEGRRAGREEREAQDRMRAVRARKGEERRACLGVWGDGGFLSSSLDGDSDEADEADDDDDDVDVEDEPPPLPPTWSTLLAFSLPSLPTLLNHLISSPPHISPPSRRGAPAHALWLCARFAVVWADEGWVDELLLGGLTRVEIVIGEKSADIPTLAFWAYNLTLLTYLLETDALVREVCARLEHVAMMRELVEDIYISLVRTAEQRLEPLLDTHMLDHTPLGPASGFDVPQFEGEWNFLKGVRDTLRLKRPGSAGASPVKAGSANSSPGREREREREKSGEGELRKSVLGMAGKEWKEKDGAAGEGGPKEVTELFGSLLAVMRMYGLNPGFIVQVFSQIFVWMSSELFNRVLTRSKYLCRSRALQIRMNVSSLEDWASRSGLPRSVVSRHFEPLAQLLQWLQCSSQIDQFANLVATIQTLRRINPFQMRRAVRDYRYEVGESHMNDECAQYLAQLQRDWDKRRVQMGVEELRRQLEAKQRAREYDEHEEDFLDAADREHNHRAQSPQQNQTQKGRNSIDALFDPELTMADWAPPEAELAIGELQNTRYVLPLVWPSDVRNLVAVPVADPGLSPSASGTRSRPSSVASMASMSSSRSSRPMEFRRPSARALRSTWPGLPKWVDDTGRPAWEWDDFRGNKYVRAGLQSDEEEEDERIEVEEALQAFSSLQASRVRKSSTIRRPERGSAGGGGGGGGVEERRVEGLPVPDAVAGMRKVAGLSSTETARSSADSSIRTPSLSVDITTPPLSPTESAPPSPDEMLDNLRRTGSVKAKRQWRQKRRERSDITVRPDEKTPVGETQTTPLKEAFSISS